MTSGTWLVRYTVSKVSVAEQRDGTWYWGGTAIPFTRPGGIECLAELTPEQAETIEGGDRAES